MGSTPLITTWCEKAHKSLNYHPIAPKIEPTRDFDNTDIYSK